MKKKKKLIIYIKNEFKLFKTLYFFSEMIFNYERYRV